MQDYSLEVRHCLWKTVAQKPTGLLRPPDPPSGKLIRGGATDPVRSLKRATTAQPCSVPVGHGQGEKLPL